MRGAALLTVILGVCSLCPAQKISFSPASQTVVLQQAENAPAGNLERAARLAALFATSGCEATRLKQERPEEPTHGEQARAQLEAPNVVCQLPGTSNRVILVGAHYEAPSTDQLADNWRTATLLPSLLESLRARVRDHTIVFVAFADHGNEPAGAEFFVAHMGRAELDRVDAMVNLDLLGFSPTKIWTSHSDKELVHALVKAMYAIKLPGSQIDLDGSSPSDSQPFAARNVPQITIHSFTRAHLHGELARQFRPDNFYDTYRLLCGYLAYLDKSLKPRTH